MDDDLLEQQQKAYKVQGVDESEPAQPSKKRKKKEYVNGEEVPYADPRYLAFSHSSRLLSNLPSRTLVAAQTPRRPNPPPNRASAKTQPST